MVRPRSATPLSAGSNPAVTSKQKSTARAVLFCLEMKRADAHEASCEATHEAGLRPMKRAFGSRRGNVALRFMATKLPPHTSVASASYRRKPMLHLKLPPSVLKNTEKCAIINLERRWRYEKNSSCDSICTDLFNFFEPWS